MAQPNEDVQDLVRLGAGPQVGFDPSSGLPRLLLVDDEPALLNGLTRVLRPFFAITTAEGGEEGIRAVSDSPPFAVVITDMRMPGIDGVGVLREVRRLQPNTVRILLTGYADLESAVAAVNEGNIFRFLTKPADGNLLRQVLKDAVAQFRLVHAERELLEGTLRGAVASLLETLALAAPAAFSRAVRIRRVVRDLLRALQVEDPWQIEVAAMLSQIGAVTLPPTVIDKLHQGHRLSPEEAQMLARTPEVAGNLLASIPRLEEVRDLITSLSKFPSPHIPVGTRIIRLASDIDEMEARRMDFERILASVRARADEYGGELVDALASLRSSGTPAVEVEEVGLDQLVEGMALAADVTIKEGTLLVGRGQEVTDSLLRRLHNFSDSLDSMTFLVTR